MTSSPPGDRTKLVGGPYRPPAVHLGDWLDDEVHGRVEVGGYGDGPIPWPRRLKTGRASLILCGDLVRAVRTESAVAVAHHFGVGSVTVSKWRVALGVDRRNNLGTRTLYRTNGGRKPDTEQNTRGDGHAERSGDHDEAADLGATARQGGGPDRLPSGERPSDMVRGAMPELREADELPTFERTPVDEAPSTAPSRIAGDALTSAQRKKAMRQRKADRGERRVSIDLSNEAREKADRISTSAGLTRTEWVNQLILRSEI